MTKFKFERDSGFANVDSISLNFNITLCWHFTSKVEKMATPLTQCLNHDIYQTEQDFSYLFCEDLFINMDIITNYTTGNFLLFGVF